MFAYEGRLRIVLLQPESVTTPATYAITFAPYHGGGGDLKRLLCYGEIKLAELLTEMGIDDREFIEKAPEQLRKTGNTSIHIVLNEEQLQRYGLGEAGIAESIRAYLGALST